MRTHDPSAEGSRIGYVPSLGPRTGTIARQAQTRGLPRLPLRVERPKDVFNPSGLNVRLVQGVASYLTSYQQTVCLRRHPIDLKERNATPLRSGSCVRAIHCYVLRSTPMGSCRTRGGAYLDRYVTNPAAAWQFPGRHRPRAPGTENRRRPAP
jgi:hypothetical protein